MGKGEAAGPMGSMRDSASEAGGRTAAGTTTGFKADTRPIKYRAYTQDDGLGQPVAKARACAARPMCV